MLMYTLSKFDRERYELLKKYNKKRSPSERSEVKKQQAEQKTNRINILQEQQHKSRSITESPEKQRNVRNSTFKCPAKEVETISQVKQHQTPPSTRIEQGDRQDDQIDAQHELDDFMQQHNSEQETESFEIEVEREESDNNEQDKYSDANIQIENDSNYEFGQDDDEDDTTDTDSALFSHLIDFVTKNNRIEPKIG